MNSWAKRTSLLFFSVALALLTGFVMGLAIAKPYFKASNALDIQLGKTLQSHTFATASANSSLLTIREQLLTNLEGNLSKLLFLKEQSSELMKSRICEASSHIQSERAQLLALAEHTSEPDKHISRIMKLTNELAKCKFG